MISEHVQHLRVIEAILFASAEPVDEATMAGHLPEGIDVSGLSVGSQAHHLVFRRVHFEAEVAGDRAVQEP